ncbi:MAG: hypothetical protein MUF87_17415 [Anaerolineae bacterium]|jgi:hypothetical protein|nr:hypothetical protein [Anaerolineae bacterium]
MNKGYKSLIIGLVVIVIALFGVGIVGAQAATSDINGPGGCQPHRGRGLPLGVIATALGLEESALRTALQGGQTVADLASEQNVALEVVIDAIIAEMEIHLAEKVAEGRLTQAEADERIAQAREDLPTRLSEPLPARGEGRGGGRGEGRGGRGGGRGGQSPCQPNGEATPEVTPEAGA